MAQQAHPQPCTTLAPNGFDAEKIDEILGRADVPDNYDGDEAESWIIMERILPDLKYLADAYRAQQAQPEMPTRDAMALASCELHRHETITEHDYSIADAVLALPRAPSAAALPSEDEIAKVCSSKCPICGTDTPHEHDALTVFHYRNSRLPFNSVEGARREWDRVQLLAFDKEWFDEYDIPDLGGHEELARAVWDRAVLALLNPEAGPEDDDHAYFEATGGVPFDHWGKGCPNDCAIPQHVEHKA